MDTDLTKLTRYAKKAISHHLGIHPEDIIEKHVRFFIDKGWVEAVEYRHLGWNGWVSMHAALGLEYPVKDDVDFMQLPCGNWVRRKLYNQLYYKLDRDPTYEEIMNHTTVRK